MTTTPRYPTTADLVDLRAGLMSAPSIARAAGMSAHGGARSWGVPGQPPRWGMHPPVGAWQHERDHGIGYSRAYSDPRTPPPPLHGEDYGTIARREASAMRSRAFACLPDTAATEAAIDTFTPTR